MKTFFLGGICALILVALSLVAIASTGWVNMSADSPHHPLTVRLIEWARERAILRYSEAIRVPVDLADAERIRRGAGNYEAMCVRCHLAPGGSNTEIRKGLYPQPPDLTKPVMAGLQTDKMDARRFWIVKHGIKASGMPAWSMGGMEDDAIWDLTAFLKALPTLTAEQYLQQVQSSDGHSHGGMMLEPAAAPEMSPAAAPEMTPAAAHGMTPAASAPTVEPRQEEDDHSTHTH